MPQFLYAAARDARVVRQCEAELVLMQAYPRERTSHFARLYLFGLAAVGLVILVAGYLEGSW